MSYGIIIIIAIIILAAYYSSFNKTSTSSNKTYSIPPEYKGVQGLDYVKKQYSSQLSQARSLCTSQFKGNWVDNSNSLGCYNMQGFSTSYCGFNIINNLVSLCRSIGGSPTCSSTQASCTV
jgi:hypothetical protein